MITKHYLIILRCFPRVPFSFSRFMRYSKKREHFLTFIVYWHAGHLESKYF